MLLHVILGVFTVSLPPEIGLDHLLDPYYIVCLLVFGYENPLSRFTTSQSTIEHFICDQDPFRNQNPPEYSNSHGTETRRFKYGNESKLSVPQFKGFTCDDVPEWDREYESRCAEPCTSTRLGHSTLLATNRLTSALNLTLHSQT
jgi:hypothetical protein